MTVKQVVKEDEVKRLREHLLSCKGVPLQSPALQAALKSLDQVANVSVNPPVTGASSSRLRIIVNVVGHILRSLVLDIPLMLLFGAYVFTVILQGVAVKYAVPQLSLMRWTKQRQVSELTYYNRRCSEKDITTNTTKDLLLQEDMDAIDCMEHMLQHGVSVYQGLLSEQTAKAARDFILKRNLVEKGFGVIANENRYSFGIKVNSDPSIQQALKEIGQHNQLQAALQKIVGPNPAIVEFTAITATFGAADQHYHQDVVPKGSAFKFARNFVPTYSLFVPLQDITAEMGSTEVCPGTHQCEGSVSQVCKDGAGLLVSGENDTWKSGNGALVNQQLFHRGTAHVDKDGPARVLFILTFASRPRFGKNQLETRMIGHEGSYSLKWSQWGHTMDDFANAAKYMAEPWATLRSLGVYKPPRRDWGWDFFTVASMRMANFDTGFESGTLKKFVKKGGFEWLPTFLQPEFEQTDEWKDYLLKTIDSVQAWLKDANIKVAAGYVGVLMVLNLLLWLVGCKGRGGAVVRSLCRFAFTHCLVLVIALMVTREIKTSQWAENIRLDKAWQSSRTPTATGEPGTLPYESDVLRGTRYQTSYLASYTRILDINHPGNRNWLHLIKANSLNYLRLPSQLRQAVAKMVLNEMKAAYSGRILRQNDKGKWIVMSEELALKQTHIDLSKASNDAMGYVLTQLGYLQGELLVGAFRDTSLHREHIPGLLETLQDKLIGKFPVVRKVGDLGVKADGRRRGVSLIPKSLMPKLPSKSRFDPQKRALAGLPPKPEPTPPYPGAWVQEGDIVDGKYKGKFNEWYRAVVVRANSERGKLDLIYDDGDTDTGTCRLCIRPYSPPALDEPVGVNQNGIFHKGRIVAVHENDLFDVLTDKIGLQTKVLGATLQRYDTKLDAGVAIEAKFQGVGDHWYRGKIDRVNIDGTFDIVYDDNDKEYGLERENIRLAAP